MVVTEVFQLAVFHVRSKRCGELGLACHFLEFGFRDDGGPVARGQHSNVGLVVERLFGERGPLHQVHYVRSDIGQTFAVLFHIEEPDGTAERNARYDLHQMVDALRRYSRFGFRARDLFAEDIGIVNQFALEYRSDLKAFRHDVVGDYAFLLRAVEEVPQFRHGGGVDDPGLVGENVEAGIDRGLEAVDLRAVAAGHHHYVAWTFPQHAREEIGAGVKLDFPGGWAFFARVEERDAVEVVEHVGTERRVDGDVFRDIRVHFLLHQRGVEMPGVQHHQLHLKNAGDCRFQHREILIMLQHGGRYIMMT